VLDFLDRQAVKLQLAQERSRHKGVRAAIRELAQAREQNVRGIAKIDKTLREGRAELAERLRAVCEGFEDRPDRESTILELEQSLRHFDEVLAMTTCTKA
jgi:hypothetical protein